MQFSALFVPVQTATMLKFSVTCDNLNVFQVCTVCESMGCTYSRRIL
jgi:hypothetical protein